MIRPAHFLAYGKMPSFFNSSTFTPTLLGFKDRLSEAEFQVAFAENAKRLDFFANLTFALMMVHVCWRLADGGAAPIEIFGVYGGILLLHITWLWIMSWPTGTEKAKWRARILILHRVHLMYQGTICDRIILYPYMKEESLVYMFHNILTASRVLVFPMLALGMRLPFRYHVVIQLVTTVAFTKLNQQLCEQCSPAMQDHFSATADMLSKVSAASALLSPQARPPSVHKRHACLAVVELVMVSCATILPTLALCFTETKLRHEFLQRNRRSLEGAGDATAESPAQAGNQEQTAQLELHRMAGLSIFPVAVTIAALPVISFLWNIHVIVDKLASA